MNPLDFLPDNLASPIRIIFSFWWLWLPPLAWKFFKEMYTDYVVGKFKAENWEFVLLEIVLEKNQAKTPKSMEKVMTSLHGGRTGYGWWEKNIQGKRQDMFSLELVSIGGNIHYYIRTLTKYRKMVESAVYGAFPNADIEEAEDYTGFLQDKRLEVDYNVFGADIGLAKSDVYPIRTYHEFLDTDPDERINDPMSQVLEVLADLDKGEQLWIQFPIEAVDDDWTKKGQEEIENITGQKVKDTRTWVEKNIDPLIEVFTFGLFKAKPAPQDPEQKFGVAQNLTPGKSEAVKAIEHNITKPRFKTTLRFMYIADINTFSPGAAKSFLGALKQFNDSSLNSFQIDGKTITVAEDFFARAKPETQRLRKNLLIDNYVKRKIKSTKFTFNTEELTTVFHFPSGEVETSTLQRVRSRKVSGPVGLPEIEE